MKGSSCGLKRSVAEASAMGKSTSPPQVNMLAMSLARATDLYKGALKKRLYKVL